MVKRVRAYRYWELGFGAKRKVPGSVASSPQLGQSQLSTQQHLGAPEGDDAEESTDEKVLDEEIRLLFSEAVSGVTFPASKEVKEAKKRKKMADKIEIEVSTAIKEGKTEISFRRRGLENTHIPKSMGKYMKEVKKLVLSDNKLFFFPMPILDMGNLHTLELKNNNLLYLPKEITRLVSLKKMDLENNQLTSLPGWARSFLSFLLFSSLSSLPWRGALVPALMIRMLQARWEA